MSDDNTIGDLLDTVEELVSEIRDRFDHKEQAMMAGCGGNRRIPLDWREDAFGSLVARHEGRLYTVFEDWGQWDWHCQSADPAEQFEDEPPAAGCEGQTPQEAARDCEHEVWCEGRIPSYRKQVRNHVENLGADWKVYQSALRLCRLPSTTLALLADIDRAITREISERDTEIRRLVEKDD